VVTLIPRTGSTPSAPPQSASAAPTVAEQRAPVEVQPAIPRAPEGESKKTPAPPISSEREVPTDVPSPDSRQSEPTATRSGVRDRFTAPSAMRTVMINYAAADDQKTALDLAAVLRETINDPRLAVRTLRTSRNASSEG